MAPQTGSACPAANVSRVGHGAGACVTSPRLLLMDEPLVGAGCSSARQEILPYLERLHDELEIPVFYVSHSPDEVARLADHLVVLDGGRALASGPLAQTLARLDLPIRLGEDVGAVLEATVGAIDEQWRLARVDFPGGSLWSRDRGIAIGRKVRIRVLARDVSLARQPPGPSSIQNVLSGRVDAVADDDHPALALVRVHVGASALIARLTRRSAAALEIVPGQAVWVQVKSVALME
jgi:molybdate transport system ATP-binding protein